MMFIVTSMLKLATDINLLTICLIPEPFLLKMDRHCLLDRHTRHKLQLNICIRITPLLTPLNSSASFAASNYRRRVVVDLVDR